MRLVARAISVALCSWFLVLPGVLFVLDPLRHVWEGRWSALLTTALLVTAGLAAVTIALRRRGHLLPVLPRAAWPALLAFLLAGAVPQGVAGISLLGCPYVPTGLWFLFALLSLAPLLVLCTGSRLLEALTFPRALAASIGLLLTIVSVEVLLGLTRGPVLAGHASVTSADRSYWYFEPHATIVHAGLDHRINAWGFRGPEPADRDADSLRVLLLGDSLPFGAGFEESRVFPWIAESRLSGPGRDVVVMNASLPGYGTRQIHEYYREHLAGLDHDLLVLCFYINDINRPLSYMRAGVLYSPLWPQGMQDLYFRTHLGNRIMRLLGWRDNRFVSCRVGSYADHWPATLELLGRTHRLARERGARFAILDLPEFLWDGRLESIENYPIIDRTREIEAWCRQRGIPYRSMLPALVGIDIDELRLSPTDNHFNEHGHRLAAAVLEELIRDAR